SASPIRKLARLDTDVDIASASASRAKVTRNPGSSVKDVTCSKGCPVNKPKTTPVKDDRSVIKRFLKMILTRGADFNRLPDTCGGIYNRCRAVVCKQGRGGDLYNDIKLELEQCMIRLARELMESNAHVQGAEWTQLLVEVCDWYHDQEVCSFFAIFTIVFVIFIPSRSDDVMYTMFNAKIFEDQAIEQLIRLSVTKWAHDERGERKPHPLRDNITKLFNYFNLHGQYQRFENMYLAATRAYYKAESTRKAEEL
ncbi:hypothetical protein L218DRAFT_840673, partial [Marasmius fiardii PR-910]